MEELSMNEAIQIAKMCAKEGMPLESLKGMGINVDIFPKEEQSEIHRMYAISSIDKNIQEKLNTIELER